MAHRSELKKQGFLDSVKEIAVMLLIVFLVRTFIFGLYQVPTGSMERTMLVGERFYADKIKYLFYAPSRGEIIALNDPLFKYSDNYCMNLFENYVWGPSNWTKRVIGVPGDKVRGTVEDGRPVVYINDVKLDEPYINPYPLIHVWKIDPKIAAQNAEKEVMARLARKEISSRSLNDALWAELSCATTWRTYDPSRSYENQPFYSFKPDMVIKDAQGNPQLHMPYQPIEKSSAEVNPKAGTNYWSGSDEFYVELGANKYWLMGDNRRGSKDSRFFGPVDGKLIHAQIRFRIWSIDSDEDWWILDLIKHPIDFWKRMRWNRFFQVVS